MKRIPLPRTLTCDAAATLLIEEFVDALAVGPAARVSTPQSCRVEQAPLSVVIRMLTSTWMPAQWDEFAASFSDPEGDPATVLAHAYAEWVLQVYADMGAFDPA